MYNEILFDIFYNVNYILVIIRLAQQMEYVEVKIFNFRIICFIHLIRLTYLFRRNKIEISFMGQ